MYVCMYVCMYVGSQYTDVITVPLRECVGTMLINFQFRKGLYQERSWGAEYIIRIYIYI